MSNNSVFNATVCMFGIAILLIHIVNLSIKPDFDYSFANWCLELIKHKECSLELFVKDFGMSLNAAKAFMGMLLYVRFVGEKYGDGRRKVLVSTEAELEYKLSWIYHNESWKY